MHGMHGMHAACRLRMPTACALREVVHVRHLAHLLACCLLTLQQAFEKYGTLLRATITLDRETGVSKGFGFVSFATADEADTAMQAMHGTMIGGKRLRIEKATAKQEMGIKEKPFEA